MDHEYWEEKLQGFLDNELEPADRAAVEEHIANSENLASQLAYFSAMKQRLRAHSESISIPRDVEQRIRQNFVRKRSPFRGLWVAGAGLALAAALVLAIFLPRSAEPNYTFEEAVLTGQVICHDCSIADRAKLEKGSLCVDGHRMGLEDDEGNLWRFASDKMGKNYLTDATLYGQEVRIRGRTMSDIGLIRIEQLERLIPVQAMMRF